MGKRYKPTHQELHVLRVLWDHGPSTTADILDGLDVRPPQSTLTSTLERLVDKGSVRVANAAKPRLYEAAVTREQTLRSMVAHLTDLAFGRAARRGKLARGAIHDADATPETLAKLREILDDDRDERARGQSR